MSYPKLGAPYRNVYPIFVKYPKSLMGFEIALYKGTQV